MALETIATPGLTGAELAVLEWAAEHEVPHTGWCPKGAHPEKHPYGMRITPKADPNQCCLWNAWEADVVVFMNSLCEENIIGTLTARYAEEYHRPMIELDLENPLAGEELVRFIAVNQAKNLLFVSGGKNPDDLSGQIPAILKSALLQESATQSVPGQYVASIPLPTHPVGVASADLSAPVEHNPPGGGELSFEEFYVTMARSWEGNAEAAAKIQNFAITITPENFTDLNNFQAASAWAALTQSKPAEAARHFAQIPAVLREHPSFVLLGENILMANHDWEALENYARDGLEWAPDKTRLWTLRAYALDKMSQTRAAYSLLREGFDKFPHHFNFAYNLACFACKLGRLEEAWDWVTIAFTLTDLVTFKLWLLSDEDLLPLRDRIAELSQTRLI